ncbi:uncharacterized protein LOC108676981 [Hyalella azteca]|uniref:Uncharacterized protein LOC108676981 n=1 Tax=Hyalella azteca TaxID=294128 RepID=A0A8B7P682_HYAAZ|nr:uncharacterized protein LOC108676981 [Hyalella azteca]
MRAFVCICLAFVVLISCFLAQAIEGPFLSRYLDAYTDYDPAGSYYEFLDYSPDLSVQGMDDSIRRVCLTGLWMLYVTPNYHKLAANLQFGIDWCNNLTEEISYPATASSLRYAGSPYALDDDYYNLYEGISYAGDEFRGDTDASSLLDLDLRVSSLIVSGPSPWTFFTGLNFTGEALCIYPNEYDASLHVEIVDAVFLTGLADNSIRSVAKGCLTDNVYPGGRRYLEH